MISPYLVTFDLPDATVCAQCGHPIWDRNESAACAECDRCERAILCSLFLLNEFTAVTVPARDSANVTVV